MIYQLESVKNNLIPNCFLNFAAVNCCMLLYEYKTPVRKHVVCHVFLHLQ